MKDIGATFKLAIRFEDFYKKGDGGFYYPFGSANISPYHNGAMTWNMKKILNPETPNTDYVDSLFPFMQMLKHNRFDDNSQNDIPNYNYKSDVSYHIDAVKFGLWLKEHYCLPNGVKHISEIISFATLNVLTTFKSLQSNINNLPADLP